MLCPYSFYSEARMHTKIFYLFGDTEYAMIGTPANLGIKHLAEIKLIYGAENVSVIAHSFGTYIACSRPRYV